MTVRRLVPFAVLLLAAGLVLGQGAPKKDSTPKEPAKPAPGSLEDTLEKALRNSADIKAAEAKVRDAEAELNRVRQQVLTRATTVHTDLNLAKRMLAVAEQALVVANNRGVKVGKDGGTEAIDARTDAILAAEALVAKHRGEIEKLATELKSLRGEFALSQHRGVVRSVAFSPDGKLLAESLDGSVRLWDAVTGKLYVDGATAFGPVFSDPLGGSATVAPTPMFDRVKKLLDHEIDYEMNDLRIAEAVRAVLDASKSDIPLRELLQKEPEAKVSLRGKLTVGAWIQAIEDTDPTVRVVIRDYGLLLTAADRVPPGALRVQDLWKGNYAQLKKADATGPEKK